MKIESIRFQNLNSLAGTWSIDLTHEAFTQEGIFTITGPTGAGKSTILDAICLALYARTPRLEVVSTTTNEIMSRLTGECFAEVTFKTSTGRYRAHWSQRRARGKADGALQAAKHEVSDADTGKVLASRLRETKEVIETLTGMDFDRFTRSILLAQGDFAKFLKAGADDRAPMLEQITGTGIYSEISQKVFERAKLEDEALKALKTKLDAIELLSPEEKEKEEVALNQARQAQVTVKGALEKLNADITWRTQYEKALENKALYAKEKTEAQIALDNFAEDFKRLEAALKAAAFDDAYGTLVQLRKTVSEHKEQLAHYNEAEPILKANVQELKEKKAAQEKALSDFEDQLNKELKPLFSAVQKLNIQIAERDKAIKALQSEKAKLVNRKKKEEKDRDELIKHHESDEETLAKALAYTTEHALDETLKETLAVIEERLTHLSEKRLALVEKENERSKASDALEIQKKAITKEEGKLNKARETHLQKVKALEAQETVIKEILGDQTKESLTTMLSAKRREREMAQLVRSLEEHRAHLKDGEPCPLCGALEHPFATNLDINVDQLQSEIDGLETQLDDLAAAQEKRLHMEGDVIKALGKVETLETSLTSLRAIEVERNEALLKCEEGCRNASQDVKTTVESLLAIVKPFEPEISASDFAYSENADPFDQGNNGGSDNPADEFLVALNARVSAWNENAQTLETVREKLKNFDSAIAVAEQKITESVAQIADKEEKLGQEESACNDLRLKRFELFENKNVEKEEKAADDKHQDLRQKVKDADTRHQKALGELQHLEGQKKALEESLAGEGPELENKESEFMDAIVKDGFVDEEHFKSLRLPAAQREALQKHHESLRQALSNASTLFDKNEEALKDLIEINHSEETLEALQEHKKDQDNRREELIRTISEKETKLLSDQKARGQFEEQLKTVQAQEAETNRWQMLRDLIGSADGKKFRNFAQGITFEMVVYLANIELQKLTGRYLLTRSKVNDLELEVIDNYQAGVIRSTKNLSGGESFLVSLALALGLAKMSSRNVSVESIFLDEGFGTLDEETLETALHMLANLHQSGKLIGVISHVTVLKDRIATQIAVTPQSEGKSVITGPGCRQG